MSADWLAVKRVVVRGMPLSRDERDRLLEHVVDKEVADQARSLLEAVDLLGEQESGFLESPIVDLNRYGSELEEGASFQGAFGEVEDERSGFIDDLVGSRLGAFRVGTKVGEGGMGSVYEAFRDDGLFEQRVALKVIRDARPGLRSRFRQERSIIARLSHPNVARLLDGGHTNDGRPYFVMEFVEGTPIDEYCRLRDLPIPERLRLVQQVCLAVHHAHQNLIVHRDIKPSNVLVDSDGQVKLLDFGIAKMLDAQVPEEHTQAAGRMLTPEYASPEHVRGDAITTAGDVYSLGVLLYRLVTGRGPYRYDASTPYLLQRAICEDEPIPPSAAARKGEVSAAEGEGDGSSPETVRVQPRRDLDAIVLKALKKEPEERYSSAKALAEDLDRYLANRPVLAHPDGLWYRMAKFYRRNRALVLSLGTSLLVLTGVLIGLTRLYSEVKNSYAAYEFTVDHLNLIDPQDASQDLTTRVLLDRNVEQAHIRFRGKPLQLAEYLARAGRIYHRNGLTQRAISVESDALSLLSESGDSYLELRADLLYNLGNANLDVGNLSEAETLHVAALEIRRRMSGGRSMQVALSLGAFSRLYRAQNRNDEAINSAVDAVGIAGSVSGAEESDLLFCKDLLAHALRSAGRLDEAEEIFRENLQMRQQAGLSSHPYTADNLNSLALVLDDKYVVTEKRRYLLEADQLMARAIGIARARLRDGHPVLANVLNARGVVNTRLGRFEQAESFHRESLQIYRERVDIEHPALARVTFDLAFALKGEGRISEATEALREAVRLSVSHMGRLHSQTAAFAYELSIVLTESDPAEALRYAIEALEVYRQVLPPEASDTIKAAMQVAKLELALGRPERAEPLLREALEVREKTLEAGNWRIGSTKSMLGECLMLLGRAAEAGTLLLEGYETMRSVKGDQDEKVIEARRRLQRFRSMAATGRR